MVILESARLLKVIEKEKRFIGLTANCLFLNDEFGEVIAPVFQIEFPLHHLDLLLGVDFDVAAFDPMGKPKPFFRVLPLANQNAILQAKLFSKLLNTRKSRISKIPWASKQQEKEEKIRSKKARLEDLFSKDVEDSSSEK